MKAKQNFRVIFVTILAIMMVSFAFLAVACNNQNNQGNSSSVTDSNTGSTGGETSTGGGTTSSQGGSSSSSQGGGSTSSGGGSTTVDITKPNPTIGEKDTLTVPEGYKEVKASFNFKDHAELTGKLSADYRAGVFTVLSGSTVRTRTKAWDGTVAYENYDYLNLHRTLDGKTSLGKDVLTHSLKIGDSASGIKVSVPGDGYLSVYIQNGSSGATEQESNVNGKLVKIPGLNASSPVVQLNVDVTKGDYTIKRGSGGTTDIFLVELHCVALDSPAVGISVASENVVELLAGQTLDTSKVSVNLNYEDGTQEALTPDQYEVDASAVDITKPGTYNVNIVHKTKPEFKCAYTVNVNELASIKVGTYATEKVANSAAGNGVYFNQSVKTVYAVNEPFDSKYVTVNAYDTKGKLYLFKNDDAAVTYTDANAQPISTATAGNYTVTVTLTLNGVAKSGTYDIAVVSEAISKVTVDNVEQAFVYVDAAYTGNNGAVVTPTGKTTACNAFKTIEMALEFLEKANLGNMPKTMYIAAGTYKEKIEVVLPNLTIEGLGATNDATLIEWDSLYGVNDASGYTQVTDSTQSVAVRDTAVNCTMKNLTISNYWNSAARFNERADKDSCDHRALAILVQSDKFVMDNCRLLGYQDTIELFYGRQLIKNSFIAGTTDFIFGTNNTTYFYNCEIKSIANIKDNQAGYVTAFKGCNKGDGDYVTYGAIFDHCNFTAEDGIAPNNALGRTWGKYAAVAVINSTIGAHISTTPGEGGKGQRYIQMECKPTEATVKFVEYNNTGAGAVSATQAGMTYLTEADAKNYSNFAVIFGTTNGKVTYADAWNPTL